MKGSLIGKRIIFYRDKYEKVEVDKEEYQSLIAKMTEHQKRSYDVALRRNKNKNLIVITNFYTRNLLKLLLNAAKTYDAYMNIMETSTNSNEILNAHKKAREAHDAFTDAYFDMSVNVAEEIAILAKTMQNETAKSMLLKLMKHNSVMMEIYNADGEDLKYYYSDNSNFNHNKFKKLSNQ